MIVLIFGQPASGKTTLSKELMKYSYFHKFFHIDGDEWREVTKNKDYSLHGRVDNLKAAFNMALFLEKKGMDIILSFVAPFELWREYLRQNAQEYFQVYLTYNEDRGRNKYFSSTFEVSVKDCDLCLNTSENNIQVCCEKIIEAIIHT